MDQSLVIQVDMYSGSGQFLETAQKMIFAHVHLLCQLVQGDRLLHVGFNVIVHLLHQLMVHPRFLSGGKGVLFTQLIQIHLMLRLN